MLVFLIKSIEKVGEKKTIRPNASWIPCRGGSAVAGAGVATLKSFPQNILNIQFLPEHKTFFSKLDMPSR